MAENKLKYTSLTYDTIQKQVFDTLQSGEFDNFRESAIAQTLIEIFTGTTDIINYYIGRRAEECYFDTAQLKSSIISLSRMLGYVPNRMEPARATIKMIIKGNIGDNQVQIPYFSKFSYNGNNYVLVDTMTYRLSQEDYESMTDPNNKNFELEVNFDSFGNQITVVQGDVREKVISGQTNTQINAPFQIYRLEDKNFSNVYGDKDFFYYNVTRVYVGENKVDGYEGDGTTQFKIDRRSLLNWENINTSNLTQSQRVCVIRSTPDQDVEILFGDGDPNSIRDTSGRGGFARKGAITRKDNIYIQYLATEGSSANKTGVIGDKINFSGKIYNSKNEDITSKIKFQFTSNVSGGAEFESADSIKYSAPKIYYSLDRLVTKQDYIAYLKSLTTPINVKNAIAWGEQEERDKSGNDITGLVKMFNVALFSVASSLYNLEGDEFYPKSGEELETTFLDINYKPNEFQTQGYFNVFVIQEMVNQLVRYSVSTYYKVIEGDALADTSNYTDDTDLDILEQVDIDIALKIQNDIKTIIDSPRANISFNYGSTVYDNVAHLKDSGVVEITGLLETGSGTQYLTTLADKISDALLKFKDIRGNKTDNANFDKDAFVGRFFDKQNPGDKPKLVEWDCTTKQFKLSFNERQQNFNTSPESPCYIIDFGNNSLLQILGLDGEANFERYDTQSQNALNYRIGDIVEQLDSRSQVNTRNIYLSPIMHTFEIHGTIYIKPLYDKGQVTTEIKNSIYEWLDVNADFNEPLYMSNIIEQVESNPAVLHTNLKLVPQDITAGWDNFTNNWFNPYVNSDQGKQIPNFLVGTYGMQLFEDIKTNIENYFAKDTFVSNNGERLFWLKKGYNISEESSELEKFSYDINNYINERTFYNDFAKNLFDYFMDKAKQQEVNGTCPAQSDGSIPYTCNGEPNYAKFLGILPESQTETAYNSTCIKYSVVDSDFAKTMNQIHKDLSYIIMSNMLDSYGNIVPEYDDDGNYLRGGYSLESEIIQIDMTNPIKDGNLRIEYK